ncbi:transposase [Bifidobacterium mongoliense]|uniref:transposase n=2 Tax=Bifidobacterium mongoliense TaxID=518643 RepID=UPI0039C87CBE
MSTRYSSEFKDRAVRLLMDSRDNYSSETKALQGVARNLGVATESLRRWQERADTSGSAGSGESAELKRLRRENAELRRSNEILSSASAFLPQGSTRHGVDGRVHRHSSPPVRGRADPHGPAGRAGRRVHHLQSILAGQSPCRQQDAGSSRDAGA